MAIEFTVILEDRPGSLGELAAILGDADINIEAIQAMPCGGESVVQLITDDPDDTSEVFDDADVGYTMREVLLLDLDDEPGALAEVALAMGDAGINLDATYITAGGQVVFGTDDLAGAQRVASDLELM